MSSKEPDDRSIPDPTAHGLNDADEVTVAADSDVLAQIRKEAAAIKRERTGENAEARAAASELKEPALEPALEDTALEDMTLWTPESSSAESASETAGAGFDPSLDATAVLPSEDLSQLVADGLNQAASNDAIGADDVTEFGIDPTVAMTESPLAPTPAPAPAPAALAQPAPARVIQASPAQTILHTVDDGATLIGSAAPPATSTSYFDDGELGATAAVPSRMQPKSRRRVPAWLLALLAVAIIVGASVAIAVLVASGTTT